MHPWVPKVGVLSSSVVAQLSCINRRLDSPVGDLGGKPTTCIHIVFFRHLTSPKHWRTDNQAINSLDIKWTPQRKVEDKVSAHALTVQKLRYPRKKSLGMLQAIADVVQQLIVRLDTTSSARTATMSNQIYRLNGDPETGERCRHPRCKRGHCAERLGRQLFVVAIRV